MTDYALLEKALSDDRVIERSWQNPHMDSPIIIAGTYRGGTSMMTGLCAACGAWTGHTMPGNDFNPKGYFEHEGLKSVLHLMLQISGYNDSDDLPPESLIDTRDADRLHHVLETLMLAEGYQGGPWVMKNPKIPFFWRYFDRIYPDAKWIITRRDKASILKSMQRVNVLTLKPKAEPFTADILSRVIDGYMMRLDSIERQLPADRVRTLSSDDIVAGNMDTLKDVMEWAGLTYDDSAVKEFIEPAYFTQSG